MLSQRALSALLLSTTLILLSTTVTAQDEKETGWFDTAELSLVSTAGNSNSTTLGFNNLLKRVWDDSRFHVELGAVRSESRSEDRFGIGTALDFEVQNAPRRVDTERYFGKTLYGKEITTRFFWSVGADAERNQPSGIEHRYTGTAGLGNIWVDSEKVTFTTSYSASYTDEELTVEGKNDFGGLRLGYNYQNALTPTTTFDSDLTFDLNAKETEDHRSDFFNALTVTMSERIALKVSLRLIYRNLPPLEEIKIFDGLPGDGGNEVGTGLAAKEKLDSNFATSLVVNF